MARVVRNILSQAAKLRYISLALLLSVAVLLSSLPAHAVNNMLSRSLNIGTSTVSASTTYTVSFVLNTSASLGSIEIELCSNDPFPGTPCTAPLGLDMSAATLTAQSGEIGFSIDSSSTANRILLTRSASATTNGTAVSYSLSPVINPNSLGIYYGRLRTFTTTNGTGADIEEGGLAFSINEGVSVSTEVPPFLQFCTAITINAFDCSSSTGNTIDFGELAFNSTSSGTSQMLATTNAANGYSITLFGTTMTAGNQIIPALATAGGAPSAPGTSQFGLNMRANSNPLVGIDPMGPGGSAATAGYNTVNSFKFVSGDTVVTNAGSDDFKKFTISYIVNVAKTQPPGRYAATISYICLANF